MPPPFVSSVAPLDPAAPRSAWFLGGSEGLVVALEEAGPRLPTEAEARALGATPDETHYLGRMGGELDCYAFGLPPSPTGPAPLPAPFAYRNLRQLWGPLDETQWTLAGRAIQIVEWDRTHRFCGRCGTPTERSSTERSRACPRCKLTAYPRLAPAIIVLVDRGEEILLARSANFPIPFFSTLAGFVEPGESLEETVRREIFEEAGVDVTDLRYFGSQPWPFPHSLMIGFRAKWAGGEIRIDPKEIAEANWFRASAMPNIPPPISIARQLIDSWLAEQRGEAAPR